MDRKAKFSLAKNYALYYGSGKAIELAQYDIAIVEPAGQSINSILEFRASGTLAIAYVSVMEIPSWSEEIGLLKSSDFLQVEGSENPFINQQSGNYWLDLRSQRWTDLLLHRISYLLEGDGYDGLFLDTVGYVESLQIPMPLRSALLQAAAQIVRKIKIQFPDCILIQNCGLEELYKLTAGYIDGICWENPPLDRIASQEWASIIIRNLEQVKETYGLQVLLLVEENDSCAREFQRVEELAFAKQFLAYLAPANYTAGVYLIKRI